MKHSFVTVLASVERTRVSSVRGLIDALGNPSKAAIRDALDKLALVHFMNLDCVDASSGDSAHLILEISGDVPERELLRHLETHLGALLRPVFLLADGFSPNDSLAAFLESHSCRTGDGYFSTPGLVFTGTPGMTVERIRKESALARRLTECLSTTPRSPQPLETLEAVRRTIRSDSDWAWALEPGLSPLFACERPLIPGIARAALVGVFRYLWPAMLIVLAAMAAAVYGHQPWYVVLVIVPLIGLLASSALLIVAALRFRALEEADQPASRAPEPEQIAAIMERENHAVQNHITAISVIKPGMLRQVSLRLVLFAIRQLVERCFRPGWLGTLGTIHFARWITVPGTRDLLFLSNFGGSWESYLEDFITKAHYGLTGVWSNTIDFPRSQWLVGYGATDGDRFKQWARRQQRPTLFWYTAYPDLTTSAIRRHSEMQQGLAAAMTDDEARHWLSLFGSAPRPRAELEVNEVQSLVFGGFKPLAASACVVFRLGEQDAARTWLEAILPGVTFGDRLPANRGLVVGFSPSGLRKLGLPDGPIGTFPPAFVHGMAAAWRARILGDVGPNHSSEWEWGGPGAEFDGCLLVYTRDDVRDDEASYVCRQLEDHGHTIVKVVKTHRDAKGTFGFTDGVSQPLLRGTFIAKHKDQPLHTVELGEFILGYPDNRGKYPPTPEIPAPLDPENVLALVPEAYLGNSGFSESVADAPHDLGRNGTFLVVRELGENVTAFEEFVHKASTAEGLPAQYADKLVAAKLVGRWTDGSSLVRNPSYSAEILAGFRDEPTPPPDNDFLFGVEDPQGQRCPFGAHIRRANPRESFDPGSLEQLAVTNRHRILRRGRAIQYEDKKKAGLMFMCFNADIERQFEFVQQSWINNPSFHGLAGEGDPLMAGNQPDGGAFTIPTATGPIRLTGLSSFVRMLGGGYLFVPGRRTLQYLARRTPGPV